MAKRKKKSAKSNLETSNNSPLQEQGSVQVDPIPASETRNQAKVLLQQWEFFSGPLPHPEIFKQYKEVDPEAAKAIIEMARKEQDHRHRQEDKLADADIRAHFRGQSFAALITVILIASLTSLFLTDHTWEAAGLGAGGFGTIILAFLRNRFLQRRPGEITKERYERADDLVKGEERKSQ